MLYESHGRVIIAHLNHDDIWVLIWAFEHPQVLYLLREGALDEITKFDDRNVNGDVGTAKVPPTDVL
jgi:hypothetical protein